MILRDAFDPQFNWEQLWFTLICGMALGLVVGGALVFAQRRSAPWIGGAICAGGLVACVVVGLAALDQSPIQFVDFRLKPYLSTLSEAAALVAAGLIGIAVTAGFVLGPRHPPRHPVAAGMFTFFAFFIVASNLFRFDLYTSRGFPRHPQGTDTSHTVAATRIIEGLELPTGLAVAGNGDLAVIELERARFSIYTAAGGGFESGVWSQLPVPEGGLGLHVAFHPAYPDQPYVYVTAQGEHNGQLTMNVLRGRISSAAVDWTVLVSGLPTATQDDGGDHFGSAIAICGDSVFVTTGDSEPGPSHHLYPGDPGTVRHNALQLADPIGKVFRYELDGADLRAAGLAEGAYPVYAFGFRNPFGIACDPTNVLPIVADNGPEGRDQIRPVFPGTNHEWPFSLDRDLYVKPYLDSGRARLAPTGVATRQGNPSAFEVIFSAFNAQALYSLTVPVSASGPGQLRLLRQVDGGAMAVAATVDGCIYFTDVESVWRLDDGFCR